ncbi:DUF6894 family protein [Rhizobium herbae]|jgi:hypothetical protein
MSKFYFHVRDGTTFEEDTIGIELPDLISAKREANTAAREMLAERLTSGLHVNGQVFEICDDDGLLVETVSFRDVLNA